MYQRPNKRRQKTTNILVATTLIVMELLTKNAFPNPSEKESIISEAFATAIMLTGSFSVASRIDNRDMQLAITTMRNTFKTLCSVQVPLLYQFMPSTVDINTQRGFDYTAAIVATLLQNNHFLYSTVLGSARYTHPSLAVITKLFCSGKITKGHEAQFRPFPLSFIAFVACGIRNVLHSWARGQAEMTRFGFREYGAFYTEIVSDLEALVRGTSLEQLSIQIIREHLTEQST
jgi:hypothetical protein